MDPAAVVVTAVAPPEADDSVAAALSAPEADDGRSLFDASTPVNEGAVDPLT